MSESSPAAVRRGRHILNPEEWRQIRFTLRLSVRELEITQHIFDDNKAEYIAEELHISVHTVNTYLQRIYSKLGVRSRSQLILLVLNDHMQHLGRSVLNAENGTVARAARPRRTVVCSA